MDGHHGYENPFIAKVRPPDKGGGVAEGRGAWHLGGALTFVITH